MGEAKAACEGRAEAELTEHSRDRRAGLPMEQTAQKQHPSECPLPAGLPWDVPEHSCVPTAPVRSRKGPGCVQGGKHPCVISTAPAQPREGN